MGEPRHAGESWTSDQDELLRQRCLQLSELLGRTWAAVLARANRLSQDNYHVRWPANAAAPSAFQILQDPPSAYLFLAQQMGTDETLAISRVAQLFAPMGIPYAHGTLIVEQLEKKGWVRIEPRGENQRVVTVLPDGPDRPGWRRR